MGNLWEHIGNKDVIAEEEIYDQEIINHTTFMKKN